jgi:hypothetical protein
MHDTRDPQPKETNMNPIQTQGTALVTGASSGIGAIYADRLAKRGCDLIPVARNKQRLASLARRIASDTGRKVETVEADSPSPPTSSASRTSCGPTQAFRCWSTTRASAPPSRSSRPTSMRWRT